MWQWWWGRLDWILIAAVCSYIVAVSTVSVAAAVAVILPALAAVAAAG